MSKAGDARILSQQEDHSVDWHDRRKQGIGGSDSPVVLGLEPYGKSRQKLWEEKTGRATPFVGNAATEFGSRMEPYIFERIRSMANRDSGFKDIDQTLLEWSEILAETQDFPFMLQHPEYDFVLGNVDGLIPGHGIVEIKTSSQSPPDEGVQKYHYPQIQHYLSVTGFDFAIYVWLEIDFKRRKALQIHDEILEESQVDDYYNLLLDDENFTVRVVESNEEFQQNLLEEEKQFWQCVRDDRPPGDLEPEGEITAEGDEILKGYLKEYGETKARLRNLKNSPEYQACEDRKYEIKEQAKQHLQSYTDCKKVKVPGFGYALWNARGYWQLKPEEPEID